MQLYAVYLHLETALHVLSGTSTQRQEHIQLYLHRLVVLTEHIAFSAEIHYHYMLHTIHYQFLD
jgi:hypothetical protein